MVEGLVFDCAGFRIGSIVKLLTIERKLVYQPFRIFVDGHIYLFMIPSICISFLQTFMFIISNLAKIVIVLLRFFRLGGGTSLPGLLIEKYFPSLISKSARKYKEIVLITGTNGKTTTQQLLKHLLTTKGIKVVSNVSGANLFRGIVSAILMDCNLFGKVRSDIAVFEVEEATIPNLVKYLVPNYIIVTNLFRDQLDAYGEVVKTRSYIQEAINRSREAVLILNSDDENVSSLSTGLRNKTIFFSIQDKRKKDIFFERKYFKFTGDKPRDNAFAEKIKINEDLSSVFDYVGLNKIFKNIEFSPPGIQNIYSAIAAITTATQLTNFNNKELNKVFHSFIPAFGRGELVNVQGRSIKILLIKNPASFTANLSMLRSKSALKLMIVINDEIADGRDVSWLWDSKVELLSEADISWITVSGKRANDMLLRLKYAEVALLSADVESNIAEALSMSLARLKEGETLYILPTYTAMLGVRKAIGNITKIREFWK
ncbi:DUF1727 domain-containing protein [Candidatus Dojkabacteria bacterium]|nr:DUF1727 domain-containing protein [Candidatus Dojkabacteria bacterium]